MVSDLAEVTDDELRSLIGMASFADRKRFRAAVGSAPPRSSNPPVASVSSIGSYDLLELIGEGGMGSVYRGRHRAAAMAARQGGDVAVKLVHAHLLAKGDISERFRREAEALAALDHPNIVKVHDVVEESGRMAIVMEWAPGRPLSAVIGKETGPIPWDRAQAVVAQLLSAVDHAHSRGVVHRDLKPDNIVVTTGGGVKLLDFGIARLGESRGRTKTGTGMGTVDYMAPEQFLDAKGVDSRADVYALGLTLYELLAGRLPWGAADTEFEVMKRKESGQIPPPTEFYPSIPPWVVAGVMAAIRPNPVERTQSVALLEASLRGPAARGMGSGNAAVVAAVPESPGTTEGQHTKARNEQASPVQAKLSVPPQSAAPESKPKPAPASTPAQGTSTGQLFLLVGVGAIAAVVIGVLVLVAGETKSEPALVVEAVSSPAEYAEAPPPIEEQPIFNKAYLKFPSSGDGPTLVVATGVSSPPMFDTRGEPQGYDIDLARALAPRIGKSDVRFIGAQGLRGRVDVAEADLAIGSISVTPERERENLFSQPYLHPEVRAYLHFNSPQTIAGVEFDFATATCAVLYPIYNSLLAQTMCTPAGTMNYAKAAEAGAALVMDSIQAGLVATEWQPLEPVLGTDRYAIAMRLGNTELKAAVDAAITEMRNDGTLALLNTNYGFPQGISVAANP